MTCLGRFRLPVVAFFFFAIPVEGFVRTTTTPVWHNAPPRTSAWRSGKAVVGPFRNAPQMTLAPFSESETTWTQTEWIPVAEPEEAFHDEQSASVNAEQKRSLIPFENPLENPSQGIGRLLVMVAAIVYGTNFASVKMLNEAMPISVSGALRFALAAAAVGAYVLFQEKTADVSNKDMDLAVEERDRNQAMIAGLEVGGWYSIAYVMQALGLMTVGAGKCAFFSALAVVVVPLLDSIFRGRNLDKKVAMSVGLALAGVSLLELGPPGTTHLVFQSGDILCLLHAMFFGIGYWRLEDVSSRYPTQSGRCTVGQLAAVAIGSAAYCIGSGEVPGLQELGAWLSNGFIVKSLLYTGLVSSALALYLETIALKVLSASEVTILMTTVSIWGSGFAYLTLGETMTPVGLLGGLMIMSGCVASSAGKSSTPAPIDEDQA